MRAVLALAVCVGALQAPRIVLERHRGSTPPRAGAGRVQWGGVAHAVTTTTQRRRSTALHALDVVRLDAPILDRSSPFVATSPAAAVVALAAALVAAFVAALLRGAASPPNWVREWLGPRVYHWLRLRLGTLRAVQETARYLWREAAGDGNVEVLADAWAPCALESVDEFGDYAVYRLALKAGPQRALPLEVGQTVSVMCLDSKNRVVRAEVWPAAFADRSSWRNGVVDLVGGAPGTRTADVAAVFDALDRLGVGAEAAVRPGKRHFVYAGPYLPITRLVCFAQDSGALPILQLLEESLPTGRSTVSEADVFWVGTAVPDQDKDPVVDDLYAGLEDLYYMYHSKMALSCILDTPPSVDDKKPPTDDDDDDSAAAAAAAVVKTGPNLFDRNPDLASAATAWKHGALAVVAGSPAFNADVVDHLTQRMQFPPECVLAFP